MQYRPKVRHSCEGFADVDADIIAVFRAPLPPQQPASRPVAEGTKQALRGTVECQTECPVAAVWQKVQVCTTLSLQRPAVRTLTHTFLQRISAPVPITEGQLLMVICRRQRASMAGLSAGLKLQYTVPADARPVDSIQCPFGPFQRLLQTQRTISNK